MTYPTSIEDVNYFGNAFNNLSTTLTQLAGISDTTIYVSSTTNFPSTGWITIEDEVISYTGKTTGSFTGCTRGADGTTAAEHAAAKQVSLTLTAAMWDRVVTELRAVMTKIGVTGNFNFVEIDNAGSLWIDMPGTPTRTDDDTFTVTDTGNANKYDKLLSRGTLILWSESGTYQHAIVLSSSYSADVVTVEIAGDSLTAGFSSMKYCINKAPVLEFIIPGNLAIGTDLAKTFYMPFSAYAFIIDAYVKTAGTTNATTFDVNDDGTTIITTKPSIASAATSDKDNEVDNVETEIAAGSLITIDIDAVSDTPPIEAYIYIYIMPVSWRYM